MSDIAIWVNESKKGNEYLSLKTENETYLAFPVQEKKSEKQPDYRVYKPTAEDKLEEVGAVWVRETRKGREMLLVRIKDGDETIDFRAYLIEEKSKESSPDYVGYAQQDEAETAEEEAEIEAEQPKQKQRITERRGARTTRRAAGRRTARRSR